MELKTHLEEKLENLIFEANRKSQWTNVVQMEIATKSYELGQKELLLEEVKMSILIDFCSLIKEDKTRKEMLKKINSFLQNKI
jgi:hypothetical protein